jgi:hypothetical protein
MSGPSSTLAPPEGGGQRATLGDWLAPWRSAVALGCEHLEKMSALYDPRHLRSLWLADLRQLTGDSLRSPDFLALMKFNLTLLARRKTPSEL